MNDARFLAALLWELVSGVVAWAAVLVLFVLGLLLLMGAST